MASVTAILQARMTSTRLPGKVLARVAGRPLLSWQIERLRRCREIGSIIIATTVNKEDDAIAEWARAEDVSCFRGSEHDVLDRYWQAAQLTDAAHLARLTGDCPLIDPDICGAVIKLAHDSGADYTRTNEHFADGMDCEVFRRQALFEAWSNATLVSEREHVNPYILNHPERYSIVMLPSPEDRAALRLTVDEPQDFELVREILEALYPRNPEFSLQDVVDFLDKHPELLELNAGIRRNEGYAVSLANDHVFNKARPDAPKKR